MPADGAAPRIAAARAVAAVARGSSLDAVLAAEQSSLSSAADRALAAALAYGVLRNRRLLESLAGRLWRRPPKPLPAALILTGLHQLRAMRIPAHAAIHATVAAAEPRVRGLINAVLRRYQREATDLEASLETAPEAERESYPDWLAARLRRDWPGRWQELLTAGNRPAPMTLRVNRRQTEVAAYLDMLAGAGIAARRHPHAPAALILDEPCPIETLPGFAEGAVSVQDAAAQLAAPLLAPRTGQRVLDACAAPGGKAAHCLELFDHGTDCELLALDIDDTRLTAVDETFARLDLRGETRCADASRPDDWWDGTPFDRILVDAPCTGTGVIRRHPDIKWLRRETDAEALAKRQRELLDALWPLLAPGGRLLYATCSLLRAEGADMTSGFLADTAAVEIPIEAEWGEPESVGRRIATGEADMDGFYYALLANRCREGSGTASRGTP